MTHPLLVPSPRWDSRSATTAEPACAPQGYRLQIVTGLVTLQAYDEAGAFYGAQTLAQLRQHYGQHLPDLVIVDWPAVPVRAVMLDVSRDKVPTMASLELMLDRFATLRYNMCILYLEHTFAHPGHDEVWHAASPFTPDEIAHLTAYAQARHITLVPQQNALGHMERWLSHPRYAHLAALPGGYVAPNGDHEPAACLEPRHPQSFPLIAELLTNVATTFDAPFVHIGLDEPIDLNPAVWDAIFDVPGAPVPWADVDNGAFCVPLPADRLHDYVTWVARIHEVPALATKQLLMWADVLAPHPDAIPRIPSDIILIEWGYDANHPFHERIARLRQHGHTCWVAPGTSAWDSLAGRIPTMQANVDAAIQAIQQHQIPGIVMCEWGNAGHIHQYPICWPGFVYAALRSWHPDQSVDTVSALSHIIGNRGLAEATYRIGSLDRHFWPVFTQSGIVADLLVHPAHINDMVSRGLTNDMLIAVATECDEVIALCRHYTQTVDSHLWAREISVTAQWMQVAVAHTQHTLGWPTAINNVQYQSLVTDLLNTYADIWLARNRIGGLRDSHAKLQALVQRM